MAKPRDPVPKSGTDNDLFEPTVDPKALSKVWFKLYTSQHAPSSCHEVAAGKTINACINWCVLCAGGKPEGILDAEADKHAGGGAMVHGSRHPHECLSGDLPYLSSPHHAEGCMYRMMQP